MIAADQELDRFLAEHVKGVSLDANAVRSHVIRPAHLDNASSDRGSEGSTLRFVPRPPIGIQPYYLDVGTFEVALDNALRPNVAGYVAQLRRSGQTIFTKEWQLAKRSQDGSESWTPDVQLHVASVSKVMTGIAMTRLLAEHGISPDAQIIDYLPDYWTKGANIEYIVFRNLLDHTSGLAAVDIIDFGIMKEKIAGGISLDQNAPNHLGGYCYQNLNYCLCRVLLAVINGNINKSEVGPLGLFADLIWDTVTIASYKAYVQAKVFGPSGVTGPTLDHPAACGLAYTGPNDSANGWNSGNLQEVCCAAAWHMTVDQVLDVMDTFRAGGILEVSAAQAMLENGFGVDPFVSYQCGPSAPFGLLTPAGTVYCKNGQWNDPKGRKEQALAYFLPQNLNLVVFANSPVVAPGGGEQFMRDVVTQVYLDNLTTQLATHL